MPAPQEIERLRGPTISAGAAQSNVLALEGYIVGLIAPDEWTPAAVSVMVSVEGDNYYDLFDGKGNEFIFNITPGAMLAVDQDMMMMARFLRLRSGTRKAEVLQEDKREFSIIVRHSLSGRLAE